jgi:prophage regulatory protein
MWCRTTLRQLTGDDHEHSATNWEQMLMTETPDRILRIKAVLARTGLSRSTLYRKIQNGTFPKNVQISTRCTGWRESAICEWLKNPMFYDVGDPQP